MGLKHDPRHMTEGELQANVIELAERLGWRCFHVKNYKGQLRNATSPGFPDLCMAHPEHGVIFAELKAPKGKVTASQAQWLETLRESGQCAFVWRPKDWPQIVKALKEEAQ